MNSRGEILRPKRPLGAYSELTFVMLLSGMFRSFRVRYDSTNGRAPSRGFGTRLCSDDTPELEKLGRALQLQQHIAETAESAGLGGRPSPMPVGRKPRSRPKGPGVEGKG